MKATGSAGGLRSRPQLSPAANSPSLNPMPKSKEKRRRREKQNRPPALPDETPASEYLTVAWAVAVTMVTACDVAAILAHLYAAWRPDLPAAMIMRQLLLFGGMIIGIGALVLMPLVYRIRRTPPPTGFAVFAACAAAAPLLAVLLRMLQ
jgi:hypothetical protein